MALWQNIPFFCILLPLGSAAMTSVLKPRLARRWTFIVLCLLVTLSAVLTAIYLMSIAFYMFFRPLEDRTGLEPGVQCDPSWKMKLPLTVLSVAIVLCGVFSNAVVAHMTAIAAGVL